MNMVRLFALVALVLTACSDDTTDAGTDTSRTPAQSQFVGSSECQSCHASEFKQWQGSHHQLAMQVASNDTVLGDFSDQVFRYFDTEIRLFRRDDGFFAAIENEQGDIEDVQITHTFGVEPLQQYLVDAPGGRKQALQITWDARAKSDGGQRWYHLYPDEYVGPDDPLHWTGRYFNWNVMCADCHSTNLQQGYNRTTDTFSTTFDEISVGCEGCHGPGQSHVKQANTATFANDFGLQVNLNDKGDAAWVINPSTGIAERSEAAGALRQPGACGRCHARRSVVSKDYQYGAPLADTHLISTLDENLYHADGQIQDEVYVYGSFVQSKMYAAGVTCSDCHNAHSGKLNAGPNPNDTCAQCHLPSKFADEKHTGNTMAGDCVSCHMQDQTYMGIDDRRDHSFRLPGTSESADHYGAVIAAGRRGDANDTLLQGIANDDFPAIARATMLTLLTPINIDQHTTELLQQVNDPDPLVRVAFLRALARQPQAVRLQTGSKLLRDPVKSVRIEAAATFLEVRQWLPFEDAEAFGDAADEFRDAMHANLATPEAALNLAEFERHSGNTDTAAELYEHAVRVGQKFAPAQHAYGLELVRAGAAAKGLAHLANACELAPDNPRYVYVWSVALNSLGQRDQAINVLVQARARFADDFDISWALATMYRDSRAFGKARTVLDVMRQQFPDREQIAALLESLAD